MTDAEQPDPADTLRDFADDLQAEAIGINPQNPQEAGEAHGLGEAVGRARARADELDSE